MTNFISTGNTYWIPDEEIQIFEKNATNGDKNSAFKLYQYHMFVSLDQDSEFKWLEIAAKNGHPIAQSNLADLFFTQGNKEKALFWAKRHIEWCQTTRRIENIDKYQLINKI